MLAPVLAIWLAAAPAASTPAAADCKAKIAELRPRLQTIQDPRVRELFDFDLKRANKELAEGDEDECAEAVAHAAQLLEMK